MNQHADIRWLRKKKNPGRKCDACGAKGSYLMEVETSWFRGDDENLVVCEAHVERAKQDPHSILKLRGAKDGSKAP